MRYVSAYLLALLGGNKSPSEADLAKIIGSVGVEVDKEKLALVVNQLKGKNIEELIEAGSKKLASVPSGGSAAVAAPAAGAPAGGAAPAADKKEDKKKKEESEDEDEDMGFGLFD